MRLVGGPRQILEVRSPTGELWHVDRVWRKGPRWRTAISRAIARALNRGSGSGSGLGWAGTDVSLLELVVFGTLALAAGFGLIWIAIPLVVFVLESVVALGSLIGLLVAREVFRRPFVVEARRIDRGTKRVVEELRFDVVGWFNSSRFMGEVAAALEEGRRPSGSSPEEG